MKLKQWRKSLSLKKLERKAEVAVADLLDTLSSVHAESLPLLAQRIAEEIMPRGLKPGR